MKTDLSETQTAFFTQNGFLEVELPHEAIPLSKERDLWRENERLKQFILKKLGPLALILTGKKQLKLGLDSWITAENRPTKSCPLKEMVSIQNLALAVSLAENPHIPARKSPLGILPAPSGSENVLFFRPDLILDWPHTPFNLFLILFALPNAVYIYNPKDPKTLFLKSLGYQYGDLLKSKTHPLILSS